MCDVPYLRRICLLGCAVAGVHGRLSEWAAAHCRAVDDVLQAGCSSKVLCRSLATGRQCCE